MSKLNLKLFFKKRKQRLSVFGLSIKFDWRFILCVGLTIVMCGIVYAVILYVQISNGSLFEVEEDQTPKILIEQKRAEIKDAVDKLNQSSFD